MDLDAHVKKMQKYIPMLEEMHAHWSRDNKRMPEAEPLSPELAEIHKPLDAPAGKVSSGPQKAADEPGDEAYRQRLLAGENLTDSHRKAIAAASGPGLDAIGNALGVKKSLTMVTTTGGDQLSKKLQEFAGKIASAQTVRVGFLEKATYPNGTPVAMVAALQEFGAPKAHIPPRPFFRNMIAAKKGEWPGTIAALLKANQYDAKLTLEQTGAAIAGQLRQSIVDTNSPPLSPVTLMLRKMFGNNPSAIRGRDVGEARRRVAAGESTQGVSTKPLVWTGNLLNSVDYEVKT